MILKNIINNSYYGSTGYIESEEDIDRLEQYILHNLPVLLEFKGIVTSTTFKDENNVDLFIRLIEVWRKYFPNSNHINAGKSRGHSFGVADNDNSIIDYCKSNKID